MYIIKNAIRNVWRSKGRSILMGIIVLVVAVAVCVSLTIRQAAKNAEETTRNGMSVTAQITADRSAVMEQNSSEDGTVDKSSFHDRMSGGLTIDELETYAKAESVKSFYYTETASVNGSDTLEPVSDSEETESGAQESAAAEDTASATAPAGASDGTEAAEGMERGGMQMGEKAAMMASTGEFSLVGYSSDEAMTAFVDGTNSVTEGSVFAEGGTEMECIISEELALYNSISVGDKITVVNPSLDTETYELSVVGIYSSSETSGNSFSMIDPANQILMSTAALDQIVADSAAAATTVTNAYSGQEESSELTAATAGTYVFDTVEDYEKFEDEAKNLGLDEMYTVSSSDYTNYTQSLVPLETLSRLAKYFLIVVLVIGAIILMVFNMFSTRERKYEIGVLTAIGMKKSKVAVQFMAEIFTITLMAVIIGGTVGSVVSVPIANSLLESQVAAQEEAAASTQKSFGRGVNGGTDGGTGGNMKGGMGMAAPGQQAADYVSEITSSVDIVMLLEVLGICILVSLIAGAVSVGTIMKYEPLTILAGRD
ncbi:ABC transporter permease [Hespellia stercorisuis]|uniref:Putative ABC transport system permease protein n=1 Tax=Hespellia stercorisuis DSM 15480 TaxID=1121950 RepID=A0A1M6MGF4_9FIRM|nr:ABC transporter permease [Hespellia stercorisuis]SHJ82549.1 putative ABC transport system permease protein [Hespellia stercorisuis DSM 15480]